MTFNIRIIISVFITQIQNLCLHKRCHSREELVAAIKSYEKKQGTNFGGTPSTIWEIHLRRKRPNQSYNSRDYNINVSILKSPNP